MSNSRRERHSETDSQCDSLTPLLKAAAEGQHEAVSRLIANGEDDILEETDRRTGRTALHFACLSGSFTTVRVLLDAGAIVDGCDDTGRTALHLACLGGHDTVADALLHPMTYSMRPAMCQLSNGIAGASIDECDESGLTPLMVAASEGHENLVIRLLDAGADTYRQDRIGRTVLHHACVSGKTLVVDIIIYNYHNSESMFVKDEAGRTSLMLATSKGFYSIVELLLNRSTANVNTASQNGVTALHLACLEGHFTVAGILLNSGANVNKGDRCGHTPLMLAAGEGHDGIVARLISAGAHIHNQDNDGSTALHCACLSGYLAVVEVLMRSDSQGNCKYCDSLQNKKSKAGRTALHSACLGGHLNVAKMLLRTGANINECDGCGCTPLMLAVHAHAHDELLVYFLNAGADVSRQDSSGKTVLHFACLSGCQKIVELLINRKDSSLVNVKDGKQGHTPLMLAALQGHDKVVCVLIAYCESTVNQKSRTGQTALHLASLSGHFTVADTLLCAGTDINEIDESGHTPLMLAAGEGHREVLAHLLSAGADVRTQDCIGRTAFHHACVSGHLHIIQVLIRSSPLAISIGNKLGHTCLMVAASQGHSKVVRVLANFRTNMMMRKSKTGQTALHLACLVGHLGVAAALLDAGASIDECDESGRTALHLACLGGHLKAADLLLHAGASIDECDESGLTPLVVAASEGHENLVLHLLSACADTYRQDRIGRTALHHASVAGFEEVVDIILYNSSSALVNVEDEEGHTSLMLAASKGFYSIVELLLRYKATTENETAKTGQTALQLACLEGHLGIVGMLLNAGAKANKCDESARTPLMLAASKGHDGIVARLLNSGADVRRQDSNGWTALHYGAEHGSPLCVDKLLKFDASVESKDCRNHTPLTIAVISKKFDVAMRLVRAGADLTQLTIHEHKDLAEEVVLFAIKHSITENKKTCLCFCALIEPKLAITLQGWSALKQSVFNLLLSELSRTYHYSSTKSDSYFLSTDPPMTELMWSCHKGYDSLVKYLILQGVDINAKNIQGNTALHFAAQGNHIQCGLLLAKAGANVRTNNSLSEAPFDVSTTEFKEVVLYALSFQTKKIVCVLGNARSGKSTLIASLQNENANLLTRVQNRLSRVRKVSECTAGIEPVSLASKRYGNVLFYDFAGQDEYHGPHELFLESIISKGLSSVAVIVVVKATAETRSLMSRQLNRWLQPFYKIVEINNPIPVIFVGSHLDKVRNKDEAKRNLEVCCEQLKLQGDSIMRVGGICCLDCGKPYAPDIQTLCTYLQNVPLPRCEDSHTGYSLPWVISQIHSSFTKEFEVLPLSEFTDWICQNKDNLPTNLPPAEGVCRDLASTGHFLYLPSKKALSEGWLVLDLPSILKDVYGNLFSSGKSKVSKFGLLSCAKLPALFPRFQPSLVRSILVSLGFGVEVNSSFLSEATHLIESTDREHEHLFIPALVRAKQPNVFVNTIGSAHIFGWQFEVDEKLFLSPRILQAVILQLASHHVFPHKQGSKVEPLACSVWLNGIFWKSRRDADVAVQISDNTAIRVIGCSEVSAEALCRYMSTVVQDIARTIKSIDANIHGPAYIVSPQPANLQFLLENPWPPAHQKFPIDVMLVSIRDGFETTISLDSPSSTGQRKTFSELFGGFKPSVEEVESFLVLQDSTAEMITDATLTTPTDPVPPPLIDPLLSLPNMETLDNLVHRIAAQWDHVGLHLGITSEDLLIVRADCRGVEQCCRDMFHRWLLSKKGTGEKPRTWEIVLSALEKANYSNVAADLRRELDPAS